MGKKLGLSLILSVFLSVILVGGLYADHHKKCNAAKGYPMGESGPMGKCSRGEASPCPIVNAFHHAIAEKVLKGPTIIPK